MGVRVGNPTAINVSPLFVRKISSEVVLGGGLVMTTVLAPFSVPVTTPRRSLLIGSFGASMRVSEMAPRRMWQSACASMAVPNTARQGKICRIDSPIAIEMCVLRWRRTYLRCWSGIPSDGHQRHNTSREKRVAFFMRFARSHPTDDHKEEECRAGALGVSNSRALSQRQCFRPATQQIAWPPSRVLRHVSDPAVADTCDEGVQIRGVTLVVFVASTWRHELVNDENGAIRP